MGFPLVSGALTSFCLSIFAYNDVITIERVEKEDISFVEMRAWNEKRERDLDRVIFVNKMEEKIKDIKLVETLEKYAGKDKEIQEMLNAFKRVVPNDENQED